MKGSRLGLVALTMAAAVLLTACGSAAGIPTSAPPATASPIVPSEGASATPPSADTPTPPPTLPPLATPSPTPYLIPTPEVISSAMAERFQLVRESFSPDPLVTVFVMKISPDGRMVAVGGCQPEEDGICYTRTVLRLIEVDTGQTLFDLQALAPVIQTLAFSPDGTMLAIGACDLPLYLVGEMDTICDQQRLWTVDTTTGQTLHEMGSFHSPITSLVWSPDGSRLYSGVRYSTKFDFIDNEITIFDTATGKRLGVVEPAATNCSVFRLNLSADGRYLILDLAGDCGHPSFVQWWDVENPALPRSIHQEVPANQHRLSPDETQILTWNNLDNTLRLFDLATGEALAGFPAVAEMFGIENLTFLHQDRVAIDRGGRLEILNLASGKKERTVEPAEAQYSYFIFTPDRRTMLSSGIIDTMDAVAPSMSLWDTETWQETQIPTASGYAIDPLWNRIAFSQDQTRIVQGSTIALQFIAWGSRPPEQAQALRALREYFDLLAAGDYEAAAERLVLETPGDPYAVGWDSTTVALMVPEVDVADTTALLEVLCTDPGFPCAPLRDVTFQGQLSADTYVFVVTFGGPDGELAAWPPCAESSPEVWCPHADGMFDFRVRHQPDGTWVIFSGLPPAIELRYPE